MVFGSFREDPDSKTRCAQFLILNSILYPLHSANLPTQSSLFSMK